MLVSAASQLLRDSLLAEDQGNALNLQLLSNF
jgi:hypothetical protein